MGILLKKRRKISAKKITELLDKQKIKISRPTVVKRLKILKKKKWIVGKYKFNLEKLPEEYKDAK